jgi:ABC-type transport system substrate-binding protein
MKRRIWASVGMTVMGSALLVATMFAGTAAGGTAAADKQEARAGGTLRIVSTSDFDYVDPALSYFSHSWLRRTCS